jgi:hypothetical protein
MRLGLIFTNHGIGEYWKGDGFVRRPIFAPFRYLIILCLALELDFFGKGLEAFLPTLS